MKLAMLVAAVGAMLATLDEATPEMRERLADPTIQKLTAARTDIDAALALPDPDAPTGMIPPELQDLIDRFAANLDAQDAARNALLERQATAMESMVQLLKPATVEVTAAPMPDPNNPGMVL